MGVAMKIVLSLLLVPLVVAYASAGVLSTSGTVSLHTTPYPPEDDDTIWVFKEQSAVAFVSTQPLDFGSIAPGTLVDSHYVQYDPASPTGFVGSGSITFDGPVLGVITLTSKLNADLSPDVSATSDQYFGLEAVLGLYPTGANPSARGLGSPEDDLGITIGSPTLDIESLEIPSGAGGNLDAFRVLTESQSQTGVGDEGFVPASFALRAPTPNPFHAATRIRFDLPQEAPVTLEVFDISGRLVRTLIRDTVIAGAHEKVWNGLDDTGRSVSSGVYLYRLRAGSFRATQRVVMLR